MSKTSKSPRKVLSAAYIAAKDALPEYASKYSPKKFTQHQLFAILVLKIFWNTDYRGIVTMLADLPELCDAISLAQVPHFTTLQKAEKRLLQSSAGSALLKATIRLAIKAKIMKRKVRLAAIDGTGFESHHISSYFVKRRQRGCKDLYQTTKYTRYPKASIICDSQSHIILGVKPGRGPSPDTSDFKSTVKQAHNYVPIKMILADAGYDSESNHHYARDILAIATIIPPKHGRPSDKPPTGRWRNLMYKRFDKKKYGQRWQIETVNSMIKRLQGSALRAREYTSQCREIVLRILTHNIMIIWRTIRGFLQSRLEAFSASAVRLQSRRNQSLISNPLKNPP